MMMNSAFNEFLTSEYMMLIMEIVINFRKFIFSCFFFLNDDFLKTFAFSILVLNIVQYYQITGSKTKQYIVQGLYVCFIILLALEPYITDWNGLDIVEWMMLAPYIIVSILGSFLKTTEWGQKWLNYYMLVIFYTAVSVILCLLIPELGYWWAILIYAVLLVLFANLGGQYANEY